LAAAPVLISSVVLLPLITGDELAVAAALGLILWPAVLLVVDAVPVPDVLPLAREDVVVDWFAVVD
jgi:hypothetical protein